MVNQCEHFKFFKLSENSPPIYSKLMTLIQSCIHQLVKNNACIYSNHIFNFFNLFFNRRLLVLIINDGKFYRTTKKLTVNCAWTPRRCSCLHDSGNASGKDFVSPCWIPIIESRKPGSTLSPSSVSKWNPAKGPSSSGHLIVQLDGYSVWKKGTSDMHIGKHSELRKNKFWELVEFKTNFFNI